jgi:hypothetical protein
MLNKTFYVLRYTIVEEEQANLYSKPLPVPKGYAICSALSISGKDRFFKYYGATYSFVGFHHPNEDERFLFGKVAKLRKMDLGEYQPGDIKRDPHDDWVPLLCLVDCVTQHILIEKKAKFSPPEQLLTVLTRGLNEVIPEEYNSQAFVKGKTNKNLFWELVGESEQIFSLEMKLLSTNLFDANKTAGESLDAIKALFGQDALSISLKNESGHLSIPQIPTDNYIDYISEGEGEWKITRAVKGRKRSFSSSENIKTVDAAVRDENEQELTSTEDDAAILIKKILEHIGQDNDL